VHAVDIPAAAAWIRSHVRPAGPIEIVKQRPWSFVARVPVHDGTCVYFKACSPAHAFEPALTAGLDGRWPGIITPVLAHDPERAWLLMGDAGDPASGDANPPELWLDILPRYAEVQRGEQVHVEGHLVGGVPDFRPQALPAMYRRFLRSPLPLEPAEVEAFRRFAPTFASLCDELATSGPLASVQHDDLHRANVYADRQGTRRIVDWGDASIAHPFTTLTVTFRFLEESHGWSPTHRWLRRLRDAYLEPWGSGLAPEFELAYRVGQVAHALAWARQRASMTRAAGRRFDAWYPAVLRRALAATKAG